MRWLLAGSIFAVAYLTLYPWSFTWNISGQYWPTIWRPIVTPGDWMDCLVNVLLYLPIGFSALLSIRRPGNSTLVAAVAGGALLSFAVEALQLHIPGRVSNLRDVLFNAAGSGLGAWVGLWASRSGWVRGTSLWAEPRIWFLAFCWLSWHYFPFVPIVRSFKLREALNQFSPPQFSFLSSVDVFVGLLLLYGLLRSSRHAAVQGAAWPWTLLLAGVIPLQALLIHQTISPGRLAGAAAALLLAGLARRVPTQRYLACLALLVPAWILIRQCYPFYLQSQAAAFAWLPFSGILSVPLVPFVRTEAGKLFLYTGGIWALAALGWTRRRAVLTVTALIAFGEFLQCYLPGRTPEISDVFIALAGAWVLQAFPE